MHFSVKLPGDALTVSPLAISVRERVVLFVLGGTRKSRVFVAVILEESEDTACCALFVTIRAAKGRYCVNLA